MGQYNKYFQKKTIYILRCQYNDLLLDLNFALHFNDVLILMLIHHRRHRIRIKTYMIKNKLNYEH
jgi:hypothetical protein